MTTVATPTSLRAWVSDSSNETEIWTFAWAIGYTTLTVPSSYAYEVQIDSASSFSTQNVKTYTSATAHAYQNGNIVKAFEIEVPRRQKDGALPMYWRVRINGGGYLSEWTEAQSFTIDQYYGQQITDEMHDALADGNAYMKDSNSSNVYQILRAYGRELDSIKTEYFRTKGDLYISKVRDANLYNNYGSLVELKRGVSETAAEYREKVLTVYKAFLEESGTRQGIIDICKVFSGYEPTIIEYINYDFWKIYSTHCVPVHNPLNYTESGHFYIKDPLYPELNPATLISKYEKAFVFELVVWNVFQLTIDTVTLKTLIKKIIPTHAKMIMLVVNPYFGFDGYLGGENWWGYGSVEIIT